MSINFEKFDKMIDTEELINDIQETVKSEKKYKIIPPDRYEVKVEKMELVKSKKGMPMVSIWFKIINGEFQNSLLFYNKVIMGTRNDAFMIRSNNQFLSQLRSGLEIRFDSYSQYAELLSDIFRNIDGKLEYQVRYEETPNGFKTFEIENVFEL